MCEQALPRVWLDVAWPGSKSGAEAALINPGFRLWLVSQRRGGGLEVTSDFCRSRNHRARMSFAWAQCCRNKEGVGDSTSKTRAERRNSFWEHLPLVSCRLPTWARPAVAGRSADPDCPVSPHPRSPHPLHNYCHPVFSVQKGVSNFPRVSPRGLIPFARLLRGGQSGMRVCICALEHCRLASYNSESAGKPTAFVWFVQRL